MSKTKPVTAEMPREAVTFRDGSVVFAESADGTKRFRMVANTGKVIPNHWYWGNFAIDLDGLKIGRQKRPALREHDGERIVGFTDAITKSADGLIAEGQFVDTEYSAEVQKLSSQGFPWEASVYVPPESVERVQAGESVEVNGNTLTGPGAVFRRSRLREVSFCTLGADEDATAAALSHLPKVAVVYEESEMNLEKLTLDELRTGRPDLVTALTDEGKASVIVPDVKAEATSATSAERERAAAIVTEAAKFGLVNVGVECITLGMSVADSVSKLKDAKIEQLSKSAPASPGANAEPSGPEPALITDEQKWEHEWVKSSAVRAEFADNKATFIAFKRAESKGQARVFRPASK
jgi:hypothetical protein